MPPKAGQTKKAKMEAANKGAKKTTKKWSKGQSREALQNAVMFDKETYDKLRSEVPKYKLITPSIISDRLKIAVSIALTVSRSPSPSLPLASSSCAAKSSSAWCRAPARPACTRVSCRLLRLRRPRG
uniref:40S ribosomal protein S25 n=1 Tax=Leishmania guyanensis TaxID=5670 RepID=A0A1E1ITZ6_LEIGU